MQSIFLHGGWRCGSTYVWNKFRQCSTTTAFYEPFSEKLAAYTADKILKDVTAAWDSRHPPLDAPYAAEYLPLIVGLGVPLYHDRFAVQRYFVAHDAPLEERDYLDSLLQHALSRSDYSVFGFSRSLGRVGALKRHYPGCHVVLMRDPVQQWLSCRSYRTRFEQPYFELCHFLILALAPQDSLAARAARWLRLPTVPAGSFERQLKFMRSHWRRPDDALSYRVFLMVYVLSYLHALPEADLLIDMDSLGQRFSSQCVARALAARTGLLLDFSDCSMPTHDTNDAAVDYARVHEEVLGWLLAQDSQLAATSGSSLNVAAWYAVSDKLANSLRGVVQPPPHPLRQSSAALDTGFGARLRELLKISR